MAVRCVLEVVVEVGGRSQALDGDDPVPANPACVISVRRASGVWK
jgi:hypothetical protein